MSDNIKNILKIYESILENKRIISEAPLSSPIENLRVTSKYGEKRSYENHPGVDLGTPSGSEVRSPEDGKVIDVAEDSKGCGGKIYIDHENGYKTRYCHMKDIKVSLGDRVSKGQIIGLSGGNKGEKGAGNSQGPHLHFEVYKDGKLVDPMQHIDSDVATFSGDSGEKSSEIKLSSDDIGDTIVKDFVGKLVSAANVNESKIYGNFGRGVKDIGGSYLLTKDKNDTVYSPVSGQINNVKIDLNCKNQITIYHEVNGKEYHLQFCGISNPYVKNRDTVSVGTILGKTTNDVTITLYNDRWKKIDLRSSSKIESTTSSETEPKNKVTSYKEKKPVTSYKSKSGYQDPSVDLLGSILTYPFRAYERKKEDKSKISKFASPTSKNQPEPGFLLNMFKKKKVDENIERIKKLLK